MTTTKEKDMVRISFEQGESGWAEKVFPDDQVEKLSPTGTQLYRIQNNPLAGHLNLWDVVQCDEKDGRLMAGDVYENPFGGKEYIEYPKGESRSTLEKFWDKTKAANIHTEGLIPGVLSAAFPLAQTATLHKLVEEFGWSIKKG